MDFDIAKATDRLGENWCIEVVKMMYARARLAFLIYVVGGMHHHIQTTMDPGNV